MLMLEAHKQNIYTGLFYSFCWGCFLIKLQYNTYQNLSTEQLNCSLLGRYRNGEILGTFYCTSPIHKFIRNRSHPFAAQDMSIQKIFCKFKCFPCFICVLHTELYHLLGNYLPTLLLHHCIGASSKGTNSFPNKLAAAHAHSMDALF